MQSRYRFELENKVSSRYNLLQSTAQAINFVKFQCIVLKIKNAITLLSFKLLQRNLYIISVMSSATWVQL